MEHLTPYRQNEPSLSPVRGRGMGYGYIFLLYQLVQLLNEGGRREMRNIRAKTTEVNGVTEVKVGAELEIVPQ